MNIINRLKDKVVVSCQAMPSEPLYLEKCMVAMMKSVVKGGAGGLRVAGVRDVKNAKHLFDVPIIGITKPDIIPSNWQEIVYITPTLKDVISNGEKLEDLIKYVRINNKVSMADISTLEEGLNAEKLGANILSTTLSGYTQFSQNRGSGPDFELLKQLVDNVKIPVVLEGRIWEPEEVDKAFDIGAHCVVIGSAITRPQLITKRFVQRG